MSSSNSDGVGTLVFFAAIIMFFAGAVSGAAVQKPISTEKAYKEGQIDAQKGILKYKRSVRVDSIEVWKEN